MPQRSRVPRTVLIPCWVAELSRIRNQGGAPRGAPLAPASTSASGLGRPPADARRATGADVQADFARMSLSECYAISTLGVQKVPLAPEHPAKRGQLAVDVAVLPRLIMVWAYRLPKFIPAVLLF